MITSQVRKVAERRKIKNPYQLQKVTGLPSVHCYRLWKDKGTQIKFSTLNTLCNALKCTPNDLLVFTPDEDFI